MRGLIGADQPASPKAQIGNQVSFSDLYGRSLRSPVLRDIIYSSTYSYTSLHPNAELVEFWIVGGGGAGGSAGANDPFWNSGVAAAGGGGAGGTGYGRIAGVDFSYFGPWTIIIGAGGAGVLAGMNSARTGGNGSTTSFIGTSSLYINGYGYGGSGGSGQENQGRGPDSAIGYGGAGGTGDGRGTGYSDITGGSGGTASITASGLKWNSAGGGCISMDRKRASLYNGQSVSAAFTYGVGAKGVNTAVPASLSSYRPGINTLNQWPSIAPNCYGGDAGRYSPQAGSLGGGGGGGADTQAYGGNGGAGFVYIIYTPAAEMSFYDNAQGGPYSRPPY